LRKLNRLEPHREQAERRDDPEAAAERAAGRAGHEQHRREHDDDRNRRAEVGLDQDQATEDDRHEADRPPELCQRARRLTAREVARRPDRERELGQLRRLEDQRPERQPAAGAVRRAADHQDGQQQDDARDHQHRRERPERAVVDP
jgi:hypothetical protein